MPRKRLQKLWVVLVITTSYDSHYRKYYDIISEVISLMFQDVGIFSIRSVISVPVFSNIVMRLIWTLDYYTLCSICKVPTHKLTI